MSSLVNFGGGEVMIKRIQFISIVLLSLALVTTACGGGETSMSPEELIAASADHMAGLVGYEFSLDYEGAPVPMDATGQLTFTSATGQYNAPADVNAMVKAASGPLTAQVSMIIVDGSQWITNPLTGAWMDVTGQYALQPAALLEGETGVFSIIAANLVDVTEIGEEEIDEAPGVSLKHLQGTLTGETLAEVSGGMFDSGSLTVDLWIDAASYELYRAQLTDTAGGIWKLDFWSFGSTFDIQPPQ
jgi:hypothetical protein